MTDRPRDTEGGDAPVAEPDPPEKAGLAPWQKVVGIVGLLVIVVVVIALLVGGGHTPPVQHGMGVT